MPDARLTIDFNAIQDNWRALNAKSSNDVETAAVVKANGYGLSGPMVAAALVEAGVKSFFTASTSEAVAVRKSIGKNGRIFVFGGLMKGDEGDIAAHNLIPLLNSPEQAKRHVDQMGSHPYGIQLDSGMNRLGMEADEFAALRQQMGDRAELLISHLACADEPAHAQNQMQLRNFIDMTDGVRAPRSLAATGGTLLGKDFHFDLCRPGVGLYGGLPFAGAKPVIQIDVPVIQTRLVQAGEAVGYAASWVADKPSKIATLAAGYADGIIRAMSNSDLPLWSGDVPCPLRGRVSMDLLTVDVTHLDETPEYLTLIGPNQTIDQVADAAGTIGYEILTSLGGRYDRVYIGA